MDEYLGLRLKLSLGDGSSVEGNVDSIDDISQRLTLTNVSLCPPGCKQAVTSFPELTVLGSDIVNVEIVNNEGEGGKNKKSSSFKKPVGNERKKPTAAGMISPKKSTNTNTKPYNTSSTMNDLTTGKVNTFPRGNIRSQLPSEDFDFAANLSRFDKARIFETIREQDQVRPEDRLVSINSPQRKLRIDESVLDSGKGVSVHKNNNNNNSNKKGGQGGSSNVPVITVDESVDPITAQLLALALGQQQKQQQQQQKISITSLKPSFVIGEESSATDTEPEQEIEDESISQLGTDETDKSSLIDSSGPLIFVSKADLLAIEDYAINKLECLTAEQLIEIGALNFAHHLLANHKSLPPKQVFLLLGAGRESAFAMAAVKHLLNRNRWSKCKVYALFAIGGGGRRIELSPLLKTFRKQLISTADKDDVVFINSLSELISIPVEDNAVIMDTVVSNGTEDLSLNAQGALKRWLQQPNTAANSHYYGLEGCLSPSKAQLVSFGLPLDHLVTMAMSTATANVLLVDTGLPRSAVDAVLNRQSGDSGIFADSFVSEITFSE